MLGRLRRAWEPKGTRYCQSSTPRLQRSRGQPQVCATLKRPQESARVERSSCWVLFWASFCHSVFRKSVSKAVHATILREERSTETDQRRFKKLEGNQIQTKLLYSITSFRYGLEGLNKVKAIKMRRPNYEQAWTSVMSRPNSTPWGMRVGRYMEKWGINIPHRREIEALILWREETNQWRQRREDHCTLARLGKDQSYCKSSSKVQTVATNDVEVR